MMHPLYAEAMRMNNAEKIEKAWNKDKVTTVHKGIKMIEKQEPTKQKVEMSDDMKKELKDIMGGDYSKGAFLGMCTNIYFNHITDDPPIPADMIIRQAVLVRLQAKSMLNEIVEKDKDDQELEPVKEQENKTVDLVM